MYKQSITQSLFGAEDLESYKVLSLKNKAPAPKTGYRNELEEIYSQNITRQALGKKVMRSISTTAEKVLDAPGIVDDYYLNLLDWSDDNVVAVALGGSVFVWNATTSDTCELVRLPGDHIVTSISFAKNPSSRFMAVGTDDNRVLLFDIARQQQLREFTGHAGRVGALAWNEHVLSSGSFDGNIFNHDVRIADHHISTFKGHEGEVCGLKWSENGTQLASGGNDNILNIWRPDLEQPLFQLTDHSAAVKALAWCPWQNNLLASGGGTADRSIRFWNTTTGECLNTIQTDSQVCSLQWSRHQKEIVSSHGFSKNQLCVWKYPSMTKVTELVGHTSRALHTVQNPDGTVILSASPDQTLRMWRVWEPKRCESKKMMKKKTGMSTINRLR